ncbi:MAG: DNA-binding domain-containing protein [Azonexaceae bacterium]|nr:DNA-binding domain-containing protein [Azonexaceae bacterium]
MSADFYDYVRGRSEALPAGYALPGLRAYRHLVFLGVSQLLAAHYPALREGLSDDEWHFLLTDFIRDSRWDSNYYADLAPAFVEYLARVSTADGEAADTA